MSADRLPNALRIVTKKPLCACEDRPASQCPGEWEPGCDLGSNPAHVRVHHMSADEQAALKRALLSGATVLDDKAQPVGEPVALPLEARLIEIAKALPPMETLGWINGDACEPDYAIKGYTRQQVLAVLAEHWTATPPAQPAAPADETGWLIEMKIDAHLLWWCGEFDSTEEWSSRLIARMVNDANKAVRFARREDAQRALDGLFAARPCPLFRRAPELYSVQEHMWPASTPNGKRAHGITGEQP